MTKYDSDAKPDDDARSGVGENALGETIVPLEAAIASGDTRKMHQQAEFAEQVIAERQARRAEPVRMEGLKPLPAAMRPAGGPGVIQGGPGALASAPSMRRSIPAPYKRPRIDIEHHGKTHRYVAADTVHPGDLVTDFGRVAEMHELILREDIAGVRDVASGSVVRLVNVTGDVHDFEPSDQLLVFRVHDDDA